VARFGLHDLRHRRLSLRIRDGVTATEAAARAGHARASMTLGVYPHVLVDDREIRREALPAYGLGKGPPRSGSVATTQPVTSDSGLPSGPCPYS